MVLERVRAIARAGWAGWQLAEVAAPESARDWLVLAWRGPEGPRTCWLVVWRDGAGQLRLDRGQMFPLPRADAEGAEADAQGLQAWLQRAADEAKRLPSDFEEVPGREDLAARGTAAFRKLVGGENALIGPIVGAIQSRTVVVEDPIAFGGHWCPELLEAQLVQRRHQEHQDCVSISESQLETLRSTGLLVMPNAVASDAVARLRKELRDMDLSRGNHGQHPSVRTDKVAFVEFSESDDMEGAFAILEDAGAQIGSWRGAPLMRPTQGMVAHYGGDTGAHYSKHFDNERDHQGFWRNHRVLTALLYLSDEEYSCVVHGGELIAEDTNATTHSINPTAGTLVLFDSRAIEHEVMPMRSPPEAPNSSLPSSAASSASSSADQADDAEAPPPAHRFAVSLWFVATTLLETDPLPPSGVKTRPPPPPPKPEVRAVPRFRRRRPRPAPRQPGGVDASPSATAAPPASGHDGRRGRDNSTNSDVDNNRGTAPNNHNSSNDESDNRATTGGGGGGGDGEEDQDDEDAEYDEEDERPVKMARVVVDTSVLHESRDAPTGDQDADTTSRPPTSAFSFNFIDS